MILSEQRTDKGVGDGQKKTHFFTETLKLIAVIKLRWTCTSERPLTHRVLCTGRTAASKPALRTGWGTLSRQKWWSCRRTRVPTPPRWSAASTQWCFHFATYPVWTAGIFLQNPPCSPTEAPRRWNRTRRLKSKGCTGQKLNYRGPFFCLPLRICVLEKERMRSGGSDERRRSIRRRALLQIMSRLRPSGLSILSTSRLWRFLFTGVLFD